MEQLTAMEQLIEWIDSDCTPMDCVMKAKELLKVEKEQMLNVFQESRLTHPMIGFKHQTFLEYYNETYGGQGSPDTTNTQNK